MIVATSGVFDVLHPGHLHLLKLAREIAGQGTLWVFINSDESVKKLKGQTRPINNQDFRSQMLLALKYVDDVFIFHDPTPEKIIKSFGSGIHVYVKDSNYKNNLPEEKFVKSVVYVTRLEQYSTTKQLEKMNGKANTSDK